MKKLLLLIPVLLIAGIVFYACQEKTEVTSTIITTQKIIGTTDYDIVLVSKTQLSDGNWEWIWTIENKNPGNGTDGSTQNLSHWDLVPGSCLSIDDIDSAAYSADGTNWTTFKPNIEQDPSIENTCGINTGNVLKFDLGTDGTNKSYYKLVINKNYAVDNNATLYYKSGNNTGCGTGIFDGIGCPPVIDQCYQMETAWAAGTRYVTKGNWATYTSYDNVAKIVTLFAGQTYNAGTVNLSDPNNGNVTITITLGTGWSLQNVEEAVKIQGYDVKPPAMNPAPGLFTTYKGNELTVTVPKAKYYGIHLDVRLAVPCE